MHAEVLHAYVGVLHLHADLLHLPAGLLATYAERLQLRREDEEIPLGSSRLRTGITPFALANVTGLSLHKKSS